MEAGAQACPACGTAKRARAFAKNGPSIQEKMKSVLLDRVRHVTRGEFDIVRRMGGMK